SITLLPRAFRDYDGSGSGLMSTPPLPLDIGFPLSHVRSAEQNCLDFGLKQRLSTFGRAAELLLKSLPSIRIGMLATPPSSTGPHGPADPDVPRSVEKGKAPLVPLPSAHRPPPPAKDPETVKPANGAPLTPPQEEEDLARPSPSMLDQLRKEEATLGAIVKDIENQMRIELQLKTSARAMANLHTNKKSKEDAAQEIEYSKARLETLSMQSFEALNKYREAVERLRMAEQTAGLSEVNASKSNPRASTVRTLRNVASADWGRSTTELYTPRRKRSSFMPNNADPASAFTPSPPSSNTSPPSSHHASPGETQTTGSPKFLKFFGRSNSTTPPRYTTSNGGSARSTLDRNHGSRMHGKELTPPSPARSVTSVSSGGAEGSAAATRSPADVERDSLLLNQIARKDEEVAKLTALLAEAEAVIRKSQLASVPNPSGSDAARLQPPAMSRGLRMEGSAENEELRERNRALEADRARLELLVSSTTFRVKQLERAQVNAEERRHVMEQLLMTAKLDASEAKGKARLMEKEIRRLARETGGEEAEEEARKSLKEMRDLVKNSVKISYLESKVTELEEANAALTAENKALRPDSDDDAPLLNPRSASIPKSLASNSTAATLSQEQSHAPAPTDASLARELAEARDTIRALETSLAAALAASRSPTLVASSAPPAAPRSASANENDADTVALLLDQVGSLTASLQSAKRQKEDLELRLTRATEASASAQARCEAVEGRELELKARFEAVHADCEELKRRCKTLEEEGEKEAELKARLDGVLEDLEDAQSRCRELEDELARERLRAEALEGESKCLRDVGESLKRTMDAARVNNVELTRQVEALRSRSQMLAGEVETCRMREEAGCRMVEVERSRVAALEAEIDELRIRVGGDSGESVERLETLLTVERSRSRQLEDDCEALRRGEAEWRRAAEFEKRGAAALRSQVEVAKRAAETAARTAAEEAESLRKRQIDAVARAERFAVMLDEAEARAAEVTSTIGVEAAEFRAKVEERDASIGKLTAEVACLKEELGKLEVLLREKEGASGKEVEEALAASMAQELATKAEVGRLEAEAAGCKERVRELEALEMELKGELDRERADVRTLKEELATNATLLSQAEAELLTTRSKLVELEAMVSMKEELLVMSRVATEGMSQRLDAETEEVATIKERLKASEGREAEVLALRAEVDRLQDTLRNESGAASELRVRLRGMETSAIGEVNVDQLRAEIKKLTDASSSRDIEVQALRAELDDARGRAEMASRSVARFEELHRSAAARCAEAEQRLDAAVRERETVVSKLEGRLEALRRQVAAGGGVVVEAATGAADSVSSLRSSRAASPVIERRRRSFTSATAPPIDLEHARRERDVAVLRIRELEGDLVEARKTRDAYSATVESLSARLATADARVEQLERERSAEAQQIEALWKGETGEAIAAAIKKEREDAAKAVLEVGARLEAAMGSVSSMEAERQRLQELVEHLLARAETAEKSLAEARAALYEERRLAGTLVADFAKLSSTLEEERGRRMKNVGSTVVGGREGNGIEVDAERLRATLADSERRHARKLEELEVAHSQALDSLRRQLVVEVNIARAGEAAAIEAERSARQKIDELTAAHKRAVADIRAGHAKAWDLALAKHEVEIEEAATEATVELVKKLQEVEREHEEAVRTLRAQHEKELEVLEEKRALAANEAAELKEHRKSLIEQVEKQRAVHTELASVSTTNDEKLSGALKRLDELEGSLSTKISSESELAEKLRAVEERHGMEIKALTDSKAGELEAARNKFREEVERVTQEAETKAGELGARWQKAQEERDLLAGRVDNLLVEVEKIRRDHAEQVKVTSAARAENDRLVEVEASLASTRQELAERTKERDELLVMVESLREEAAELAEAAKSRDAEIASLRARMDLHARDAAGRTSGNAALIEAAERRLRIEHSCELADAVQSERARLGKQLADERERAEAHRAMEVQWARDEGEKALEEERALHREDLRQVREAAESERRRLGRALQEAVGGGEVLRAGEELAGALAGLGRRLIEAETRCKELEEVAERRKAECDALKAEREGLHEGELEKTLNAVKAELEEVRGREETLRVEVERGHAAEEEVGKLIERNFELVQRVADLEKSMGELRKATAAKSMGWFS
ncbi:hypothetical protein HK101_001025, partial [Irineochytrium annulatum]